MELPKQIADALAPFGGQPQFLCIAGSKLYGTSRADSDTDYRGFIETTAPYLLGRFKFEQAELNDESNDIVVYSFQKFLSLIAVGSPNTIELLFVPDEQVLIPGTTYNFLKQHRESFVTQDSVYPTIAFAKASWKRFVEKDSVKDSYHAIRLLMQAYSMLRHKEIKFPLEEYQRTLLREIRDSEHSASMVRTTEAVYLAWLNLVEGEYAKGTLPKIITKALVDEIYYSVIENELSRFIKERRV